MKRFFALLVCLAALGCSRDGIERVEWPSMGTVAALQWRGTGESPQSIGTVRDVFAKIERLLNAHDPNSELNRLASLPDEEIIRRCDPFVRECYVAAFRLRDETGGAFNPRWRGKGTMDLGAIAKGFAVDCAKFPGLIDLGGNLKASSGRWRTGIAGTDETFDLEEGSACATSSECFRGKHIRNGRDGSVISNGLFSITVIHPNSAMLADGLSTVMFLLGREAGEKYLKEFHPEAKAIWYTERK